MKSQNLYIIVNSDNACFDNISQMINNSNGEKIVVLTNCDYSYYGDKRNVQVVNLPFRYFPEAVYNVEHLLRSGRINMNKSEWVSAIDYISFIDDDDYVDIPARERFLNERYESYIHIKPQYFFNGRKIDYINDSIYNNSSSIMVKYDSFNFDIMKNFHASGDLWLYIATDIGKWIKREKIKNFTAYPDIQARVNLKPFSDNLEEYKKYYLERLKMRNYDLKYVAEIYDLRKIRLHHKEAIVLKEVLKNSFAYGHVKKYEILKDYILSLRCIANLIINKSEFRDLIFAMINTGKGSEWFALHEFNAIQQSLNNIKS